MFSEKKMLEFDEGNVMLLDSENSASRSNYFFDLWSKGPSGLEFWIKWLGMDTTRNGWGYWMYRWFLVLPITLFPLCYASYFVRSILPNSQQLPAACDMFLGFINAIPIIAFFLGRNLLSTRKREPGEEERSENSTSPGRRVFPLLWKDNIVTHHVFGGHYFNNFKDWAENPGSDEALLLSSFCPDHAYDDDWQRQSQNGRTRVEYIQKSLGKSLKLLLRINVLVCLSVAVLGGYFVWQRTPHLPWLVLFLFGLIPGALFINMMTSTVLFLLFASVCKIHIQKMWIFYRFHISGLTQDGIDGLFFKKRSRLDDHVKLSWLDDDGRLFMQDLMQEKEKDRHVSIRLAAHVLEENILSRTRSERTCAPAFLSLLYLPIAALLLLALSMLNSADAVLFKQNAFFGVPLVYYMLLAVFTFLEAAGISQTFQSIRLDIVNQFAGGHILPGDFQLPSKEPQCLADLLHELREFHGNKLEVSTYLQFLAECSSSYRVYNYPITTEFGVLMANILGTVVLFVAKEFFPSLS